MKLLIAGGVAVLLGLAGGSIVSGNRIKRELLQEAARTRAQSTARMVDPEDETGSAPSGQDTLPEATARPVGGDGAPPTGSAVIPAADESSARSASTETAGTDAADMGPAPMLPDPDSLAEARARVVDEGARKLSQIFGAMQAQDAANVLQEMDDQEIELILKHMNDRLAAQILGVFEPGRAALLSRAVLGLSGEGG